MAEGLVTRIGRWIDHRWESKATESMVLERWNNLENAQIRDKVELESKIEVAKAFVEDKIRALTLLVQELDTAIKDPSEAAKELAELKTRIEKIELYSGMTRKVDPTKAAVVKSAFSM